MNLPQQQPVPGTITTSSARNEFLQNYVDGKGRGNSLLTKDRKDRLNELSTTAKYDPTSKTYDLNWFQRNVLGITDQDTFNAQRSAELELINDQLGGKYEDLGLGKRIKGNANFDTIARQIKDEDTYKSEAPGIKKQLAEVGGGYGTAALQELGRKPSILDMQSALRTAQQNWEADPSNETSNLNIVREAKARQLEATKAQTLAATRANILAQQTLTGQIDGQRFQAQLAAENARNRWEDKRQNRADNALTRQMNAENNAMQMQLEYGRLNQADQFRAQDRRDQAIMMLVQGLTNMGVGITV